MNNDRRRYQLNRDQMLANTRKWRSFRPEYSDTELCSVHVVSLHLHMSVRRVQQLARCGILPRGKRGRYPLLACLGAYLEHLRKSFTRCNKFCGNCGREATSNRALTCQYCGRPFSGGSSHGLEELHADHTATERPVAQQLSLLYMGD